jgi:DNA polymerase-1
MIKYFTDAGHTDWPTTELGNPSFTEKWLNKTPEGQKIVSARKVRTIIDQFIQPMVDSHVFKGRVHTSFNQLRGDGYGVISGRFSSSFPNLQQVPKHNHELSALYRSIFAADPGYLFYEADYSQCEPRLFAHYSKAPALVEGYNSTPPVDMHDVVAKMMNADRETVAKRMNMGLLTGMWPKTLAEHMGWDIGTAKRMWNEWFGIFPEIRTFQDKATHIMGTRGFVRTILGRRCRLDNPRFAYQATSRIIQGSNADILKWKMREALLLAEQMGDHLHMLLTVHDSLEWQATDDARGRECSREIVEACSDVQCEPFNLRVPFKMDVKRGVTWSEATFGKKLKLGEINGVA